MEEVKKEVSEVVSNNEIFLQEALRASNELIQASLLAALDQRLSGDGRGEDRGSVRKNANVDGCHNQSHRFCYSRSCGFCRDLYASLTNLSTASFVMSRGSFLVFLGLLMLGVVVVGGGGGGGGVVWVC